MREAIKKYRPETDMRLIWTTSIPRVSGAGIGIHVEKAGVWAVLTTGSLTKSLKRI